jgi:hypothetical protein
MDIFIVRERKGTTEMSVIDPLRTDDIILADCHRSVDGIQSVKYKLLRCRSLNLHLTKDRRVSIYLHAVVARAYLPCTEEVS